MLWKLDALQSFIRDLRWPEEVFAEHLDNRLKIMAADMIEAAAKRTLKAFETWLKKGSKGTDYIIHSEVCVMVNVITDCKNKALHLCALDSGENILLSVLESVLSKLARYDEGTFFSSILSLTKPVNEIGKAYVDFMRGNLEQLRQRLADELLTLNIFEQWYTGQTKLICDWLTERLDLSLHPYQLTCIMTINKYCLLFFFSLSLFQLLGGIFPSSHLTLLISNSCYSLVICILSSYLFFFSCSFSPLFFSSLISFSSPLSLFLLFPFLSLFFFSSFSLPSISFPISFFLLLFLSSFYFLSYLFFFPLPLFLSLLFLHPSSSLFSYFHFFFTLPPDSFPTSSLSSLFLFSSFTFLFSSLILLSSPFSFLSSSVHFSFFPGSLFFLLLSLFSLFPCILSSFTFLSPHSTFFLCSPFSLSLSLLSFCLLFVVFFSTFLFSSFY
ncbi:CADPS [Acanthosepion pharaonis]|uniref:CADPS n=1 Tax=Acanthosepion pharaonis TaxID=158019 RepID=A0A812DH14_ACAPH|nr:CADPS [Sepia pharaonis]